MNVDQIRERLLHDAMAHQFVHSVYSMMRNMNLTPAEVRDLAAYAALKFEMEHATLNPALFTREGEVPRA